MKIPCKSCLTILLCLGAFGLGGCWSPSRILVELEDRDSAGLRVTLEMDLLHEKFHATDGPAEKRAFHDLWKRDQEAAERQVLESIRQRGWNESPPETKRRLRAAGIDGDRLTRENVVSWLAKVPFVLGLAGSEDAYSYVRGMRDRGVTVDIDRIEGQYLGEGRVRIRIPMTVSRIESLNPLMTCLVWHYCSEWSAQEPKSPGECDGGDLRDRWMRLVHGSGADETLEVRWSPRWKTSRTDDFGVGPPPEVPIELRVQALRNGLRSEVVSTRSTLEDLNRSSGLSCRVPIGALRVRGTDEAPAESGVLRAVLVGVSTYDSAMVSGLPFCDSDVAKLAAVLDSYQVTAIRGRQAERISILGALNELSVKSGPRDTLLVFWSGHGVNEGEDFFLLPRDYRPEFPARESAVNFRSIREIIEKSDARQKILIVDSCFAGLAGKGSREAQISDGMVAGWEGTLVLTSCRPDELSWVDEEARLSFFTKHLTAALAGGADGYGTGRRDGWLTFQEVYEYTYEKTKTDVLATRGQSQRPRWKGGSVEGRVILKVLGAGQ